MRNGALDVFVDIGFSLWEFMMSHCVLMFVALMLHDVQFASACSSFCISFLQYLISMLWPSFGLIPRSLEPRLKIRHMSSRLIAGPLDEGTQAEVVGRAHLPCLLLCCKSRTCQFIRCDCCCQSNSCLRLTFLIPAILITKA